MATTRTDFGTFPDTATSVDSRAMTGTRLSPYRVAMSGACIAFNHPPTAPWGVHGGRTRVAFLGAIHPHCTSTRRPERPYGGSHRCGAGGIVVRGDRPLGISGRLLKPVRPKLSGVRFRAGARPPGSPTITASVPVSCRSNPPEKKSDEAPVRYYRLPIFRKEIHLWTSIANGHRGSNVCCQGQSRRAGDVAGESVVSHKET